MNIAENNVMRFECEKCAKSSLSVTELAAGHHPWLIRPLDSLLYGSRPQKRIKPHPQRGKGSVWSIYVLLALWGNLQRKTLLSRAMRRTGRICRVSKIVPCSPFSFFSFFFSFLSTRPNPEVEVEDRWKKRRACKLNRLFLRLPWILKDNSRSLDTNPCFSR